MRVSISVSIQYFFLETINFFLFAVGNVHVLSVNLVHNSILSQGLFEPVNM